MGNFAQVGIRVKWIRKIRLSKGLRLILAREGKGRISEVMGLMVPREGVINLRTLMIVFIFEFILIYIIKVKRSVRFQYHALANTVVRRKSDLLEESGSHDVQIFMNLPS